MSPFVTGTGKVPRPRSTTEPNSVDGRTRVRRIVDVEHGPVIRKESLGAQAVLRVEHQTSILRRLQSVPGVPKLLPSLDPRVLVVVDVGAPSLAEVFRERRLSAAEVIDLGERLALTLAGVHRAGVIHHDLHPWNVTLGDVGAVELFDFDFATTTAEVRPDFVHHAEIRGRLPYLAPEQTGRTGYTVDHRSDLYGLGALLYEAASGGPPFVEPDAVELVRAILTHEPALISELNPSMPTGLAAVIARLLQKEPNRRYQSAAGVAHDLALLGADPAGVFTLGQRDYPSRLSAPTQLVGRDTEVSLLIRALDSVTKPRMQRSGDRPASRAVLVSGSAGVGKSALVNQLRLLVSQRGGWFVAGKSDQVARDSSAGLLAALQALARLLLAEPTVALHEQIRVIRRGLGSNANLLVTLVPEFAQILGQPSAPADLDDRQLEDRTRQAILDLLRAVASPSRPLVLFLDDLQWAPPSALDVLDALVNDFRLSGLLLVGAYRDAEVGERHRLMTMTAGWQRRSMAAIRIRLSALEPDLLTALLGQMLRLPDSEAAKLAAVVSERTGGNPFDTIELLNALREDRILTLEHDGWTWDETAVLKHVGSADVVELIRARIESLGAQAARTLSVMACLGGEASSVDLAVACDLAPADLAIVLAEAMESGLLTPAQVGRSDDSSAAGLVRPRFRHDRIQQAAFERLAEDERRALQSDMARRLSAAGHRTAGAKQFLAAQVTPADVEEQSLVVHLYRWAADQERRRANHQASEQFLAAAADVLRAARDSAYKPELIEVETEHHSALYQLGRLDDADAVFAMLSERTHDPLSLARATATQVASLTNRHQMQAAVDLGLTVLAGLGLVFPERDVEDAIRCDLAEVVNWTRSVDAAADAARAPVSEPTAIALAALLGRMSAPAFFCAPLVSAWVVVQAKRLWEEHGPSSTLMDALGHGQVACIAVLRDYRAGEDLLKHLLIVGEAHHWERAVSYMRFLQAVSSVHWFEPLDACRDVARQARDELLHVGDLPQACWAYFPTVVDMLETAPRLEEPLAELAAARATADRTGILPTQHVFAILHQFCRAAQGGTENLTSLSGEGIAEQTFDALADHVPLIGAYLRLYRSILAVLVDDQEMLARDSRLAHQQSQSLPGIVINLFATMPLGRHLAFELRRTSAQPARAQLLAELDQLLDWLRDRAKDQPDNVTHYVHYLEAERAWALDDFGRAAEAFEAALNALHGLSRPWNSALIARRAGELHLEQGREHIGRLHLMEAHRTLRKWGATALVASLEAKHPFLRDWTTADRAPEPGPAQALNSDAIDTTAILRVAQALASQTTLAQLHVAIVEQLRAITGATAVRVVLQDDERGAWQVHRSGTDFAPDLDDESAAKLVPISAVRYALRTRAVLAVQDATTDDRFARDPYLTDVQRLALLVIPVLRSGDLRALLVLENDLSAGAFSADRLGFVTMLTGQLAVALDNAQLYASLERRIDERTQELSTANARLEMLSSTDALTGIANRRHFDATLAAEWARSRDTGLPISLIMVDVDRFKVYNDALGHPAGDVCLVAVSRTLASNVRDSDQLCRYGGEEFAVILPNTDIVQATAVAERIRLAVELTALPHAPGAGLVTVSAGVASRTARASDTTAHAALVTPADAALYAAKRAGRNCVQADGNFA